MLWPCFGISLIFFSKLKSPVLPLPPYPHGAQTPLGTFYVPPQSLQGRLAFSVPRWGNGGWKERQFLVFLYHIQEQ